MLHWGPQACGTWGVIGEVAGIGVGHLRDIATGIGGGDSTVGIVVTLRAAVDLVAGEHQALTDRVAEGVEGVVAQMAETVAEAGPCPAFVHSSRRRELFLA